MPAKPFVIFFKDIDKGDVDIVGGKGANLGEMTRAGFPVPYGFAITVEAYKLFLKDNLLDSRIYSLLKKTDVNNSVQLEEVSRTIQRLIKGSGVTAELAREIIKAYRKLSGPFKGALVAVRSSATAEDMPDNSFAGQQATFLNIQGEANLIESVRDCWASLFTARSIFYRTTNKIEHDKVYVSVVVQKMVQSEVSGVMFTIDPVTNEKDKIVIESVWGLGELIVQGSVIPDRYLVQKESNEILSKEVSEQSLELVKVGSETKEFPVPKNKLSVQKISDSEIMHLAKIGENLQAHYFFPQDIEWAKEKGKIYIVQTRPVTTSNKKVEKRFEESKSEDLKVASTAFLTGSPASPGIGFGPVKIAKTPKDIDKVQKGDVLVSIMTSPDFVPAMKKAAAIITDEGGGTSHAAIVSRELGVPCVVGTKEATKKLKDGQIVSVNGSTGHIFLGAIVQSQKTKEVKEPVFKGKTATKVYVNLAEPERAKEVSKLNVDGVGLLRAEFMIANIGIHPKEAIKLKKQAIFVNNLANDLATFCKAFDPRPVVYRATDFKTNEYRQLKGGRNWEPEEPNPMLGFRGAFRYITNPDVFSLELQAIKKVRANHKNLMLMIPFVRSPEELSKVRRLVASEDLFSDPSFKFWIMVELPVNVILLEEFIKVGIDGVSIGSNDLTMLLLGTDRDNANVAGCFDERSPAVLWALKRVIRICNKHGVSSSICGQAPSTYDDLVEYLVKIGATSLSINPDAVNHVRHVVYNAETSVAQGKT
ncbi:phosphoenolpyruvate synthase [Candidatus Woesebacteria bacterium RIFCSPHIGHO2_02_FULL_38_9]|uniref:Phosphoenolpyruvate synthase n=1 Tax=Candidatus Woesebacteria bacterium RIFCSPHIGHO2_01_FULL_39_28 TaxID=1802496 RepID=A0A1F7YKY5_9BACT|nr:MAG: phosphoenolpyruvate synthase [Candidatus Woesebacteria bacterium RIFCSPHIGHO2_01_FULL_39_28]OGM31824.1 MAG: phosphoenolpyruvate synthase [Candidatus Woesebacteria bacterium RIFCSPHIGHO2_02_FULL_38_9]OGM56957.1 MAG: phosphoenolpyruvate synthase [Candidatus Woesebacteria bacterium RIFCSPLOWO2_01_FULL_38_20]